VPKNLLKYSSPDLEDAVGKMILLLLCAVLTVRADVVPTGVIAVGAASVGESEYEPAKGTLIIIGGGDDTVAQWPCSPYILADGNFQIGSGTDATRSGLKKRDLRARELARSRIGKRLAKGR
jgi:hypothetical protein